MSSDRNAGGHAAEAVTERLAVPEMDCPSCAQKVEKRLQRFEGIASTSLSPTTGTVTVTFDPGRTSGPSIVTAIESIGYDVVDPPEGPTGDTEAGGADIAPATAVWTSRRAILTWVGAAFLTVGLISEFLAPIPNPAVASLNSHSITVSELLFAAAVATSGTPVVRSGYYSAKSRSLDIDLLMGTAIIAATGIGYFVEAATLAVLFSIAELMEQFAMDRARDSLRELIELSPDEATVERDGRELTVPAEAVAVGETVVIRPGEKVPLDGSVVGGGSAVDESPITGESVPVDKREGDDVYAGSLNREGFLRVRVTAPASESTLARIIELVEGAQTNRTETERFVDRFAGYYTPLVVALAIMTATVPPLLIADPFAVTLAGASITFTGAWGTWFVRGLTLLVIACPCAFVISTPVSVVSGITSAAKHGVLIKGGDHLEAMGAVKAIALDKTGTLTTGELAVTDVVPINGSDERTVLRFAAALEQRSDHPIARAILEHAAGRDVEVPDEPTAFESLTGKGLTGRVDGRTYYVGKPALFGELGVERFAEGISPSDGSRSTEPDAESSTAVTKRVAELERAGKTVVLVGTDTAVIGLIAIADGIRPGARSLIDRLHAQGIDRIVMLTGDNERTARAIADEVGVDDHRAGLLPEGKVDAIKSLRSTYGTVAMVGDGVNDAPALATADVGIVMGAAGSDTALETADIALMADDLSKLPYLSALSHRANTVIRENIWSSLGVKFLLALGVPIGLVSVALAVVVGDMGMSLGVTANAMRLSRVSPDSDG